MFSLNTDLKIFLKFFQNKKQICIFIKYKSKFFFEVSENFSETKIDLYFHLIQILNFSKKKKKIYIFIKYRFENFSEVFFKTKTDLYFH